MFNAVAGGLQRAARKLNAGNDQAFETLPDDSHNLKANRIIAHLATSKRIEQRYAMAAIHLGAFKRKPFS